MPHPHPDAVADCVLQAFRLLPSKFKPRKLADGRKEWVPLAGIVLSRTSRTESNGSARSASDKQEGLTCAALATGMKCLPQSKVPYAKGNVLHDSHAEVLAMRAFNRFLVDECADLARRGFGSKSQWVRWRDFGNQKARSQQLNDGTNTFSKEPSPLFELHDDVRIHMYCSECPCGDASMELIMRDQQDATPWTESNSTESDLLGRGHFNQFGVVRRKPARADAPMTLSKSCSDKLAMKQVTSLLSNVVSRLVWPGNAYLSSLILPEDQVIPAAVERAWSRAGRMRPLTEANLEVLAAWKEAGYSFQPFSVQATSRMFEYSKPSTIQIEENRAVPSNLSAISTPSTSEILINGVLQGRRQLDPLGASSISRRRMWSSVLEAAQSARDAVGQASDDEAVSRTQELIHNLSDGTYAELKAAAAVRQEVKSAAKEVALKGWKKNEGDDDFYLIEVQDIKQ